MALKVHKAHHYSRFGESRVRSLCGRASGFVWNPETVEFGQNLSDDSEKVTCEFCKRLIKAQAQMCLTPHRSTEDA